jgi:antitoxin component of MazEF toxin-antitoxin module
VSDKLCVMKTKLIRAGDSVALILDEALLEQHGLDENSEVELSVRDGSLIITPIHDDSRRRRIEDSMKEIDERYANLFRRLADS